MKTVSITEAQKRIGSVLDAAQSGPIVIRRGNDDLGVVVSMTDYERLRAGDVAALLDYRNEIAVEAADNGLTEGRLKEILDSES